MLVGTSRTMAVLGSLAMMVASTSAQAAANCPFPCQNNAVCKEGTTSFSDHPTELNGDPFPFLAQTTDQGHYCECPDGFTGIRCGREYERCDHTLRCYNGGTCTTDGQQNPVCDCSNASHGGKKYIGKFCEYRVDDGFLCDGSGDFFCLNEGICKTDFATAAKPCRCSGSFSGDHCEFETGAAPTVVTDDAACTLECGSATATCKNGAANFDNMPTRTDGSHFDFLNVLSEDEQSCECSDHFTGYKCDIPVEKCNRYEHMCFHGGKCIQGLHNLIDDPDQYFCDCSEAEFEGHKYVGKYCESKEENRCNDDGSIYCLNHGTCNPDIDFDDPNDTRVHASPCQCHPGHRGEFCQYETGTIPHCSLTDCQNGGVCRLGLHPKTDRDGNPYPDFWDTHDNYMYCECPEGWYGNKCEIPAVECGDVGQCYNGGECMEGVDTKQGNAKIYQCNCLPAANGGTSYGGKHCQIPSTSHCTDADHPNGKQFCANNGTCKANNHEGCDCPQGFHGPNCDLKDGESNRNCDLQCQNGGHCRLGPKDNTLWDALGAHDTEVEHVNDTHSSDLMHCVCPDGFFGLQCETRLQVCAAPDDETNGIGASGSGTGASNTIKAAVEHVCLHGSVCATTRDQQGTVHHTCNCDASNDNTKRAGRYCQFDATMHCTENGRPGHGSLKDAFCVNEGECMTPSHNELLNPNRGHPGCICPSGWEGDHCEYPKGHKPGHIDSKTGQGGAGRPDPHAHAPDRPGTAKKNKLGNNADKKKSSDGATVVYVIMGLAGLGLLIGVAAPRIMAYNKEFDTAKGETSIDGSPTIDMEPSMEDGSDGTFEGDSPRNGDATDPEWNSITLGPARAII